MSRKPADQSKPRNGGKWIRPERRLALYIRDRFECLYCGRDLRNAPPKVATLDHLLPRIAGGTNEATNLVTACVSCNSSRQDKPWMDYATGGAVERIQTQRVLPLNVELARAILNDTVGDREVEAVR